MRKQLALLIIIFLFPFLLMAKSTTYINLGANISSFRTEGGKSKLGLSLGFGKKYYIIQSFNVFWGFDLGYNREKIELKDKTFPIELDRPYSGVQTADLQISLSYFDISLYLGFPYYKKKKFDLQFFIGPSLSIPVGNNTKRSEVKTEFLEPEEISNYDFDYYLYDADPDPTWIPFMERGMNLNTGLTVGTILHLNHIHLTLSYLKASTKTEGITDLTLFDKIDRLTLSIGISLSFRFTKIVI